MSSSEIVRAGHLLHRRRRRRRLIGRVACPDATDDLLLLPVRFPSIDWKVSRPAGRDDRRNLSFIRFNFFRSRCRSENKTVRTDIIGSGFSTGIPLGVREVI